MKTYKRYLIVEVEIYAINAKEADRCLKHLKNHIKGLADTCPPNHAGDVKRICHLPYEDILRLGMNLHLTKRVTAWFKPIFTALHKKHEQQRKNGTRW